MNIIVTTSVLLAVAVSLGSCVKICPNPESYAFKVVCDAAGNQCGECVSFVKVCTGDKGRAVDWAHEEKVYYASNMQRGTAIATFINGKYPTEGRRHAAIFESRVIGGFIVWDQWVGRPVNRRLITWNGNGLSNNGLSFYIIK